MSDRERKSPFYVGHEEEMPGELASFLRPRLILLLIVLPLLLGGFAAAQRGFVPSFFEFGQERELIGWISTDPVPALVSLRPGNTAHCGMVSRYPLVTFGKFGAREVAEPFEGQQVRVRGTLSYLDSETMIELASEDGIVAVADAAGRPAFLPPGRIESFGQHVFSGEIVDSKCNSGVMNPGHGKVHRGCAARCISGGIPPSFMMRDGLGGRLNFLLVDAEGRGLGNEILDRVGRPVRVSGEVVRYDDLLVLRADPGSIAPLPPGAR